jgi:digeranylgeranylglycerophospholipid reductase
MRDVVVIGGGPAGLAAAVELARRGHSVSVFEEHASIGAPVHCTGVLAAEAVDALDLPRHALLNPLSTVRFVAPSGRAFEYTTSKTEAVVIDRMVFDRALADAAIAAGVSMTRGRRVTAVSPGVRSTVVTMAGGETIESRAAVIACGAQYGLQRRLGLDIPPVYLHSAQFEFPAALPRDVEIFFGSSVAPKGFAWVVPVRRGTMSFARVGVMAATHASSWFTQIVRHVQHRWDLDVPNPLTPRRRVLPLAAVGRTYHDRVLLVGDAAGLVKPTTGGGIYYSIVSGRLAAEVLSEQLQRDELGAPHLARYEKLWRKRFQSEFSAQLALRRVAEGMDDDGINALFDLARTDGVLPLVRRYAAFNRHRDFIKALFRHQPARQVFRRQLAAMLP